MTERPSNDEIEGGVSVCKKLTRGQLWCYTCGKTEKVNSGKCLSLGWPTCCGETMSLDSPEERASQCKRCNGTGSITKPVDGRFREPETCPDCEKYRALMEK